MAYNLSKIRAGRTVRATVALRLIDLPSNARRPSVSRYLAYRCRNMRNSWGAFTWRVDENAIQYATQQKRFIARTGARTGRARATPLRHRETPLAGIPNRAACSELLIAPGCNSETPVANATGAATLRRTQSFGVARLHYSPALHRLYYARSERRVGDFYLGPVRSIA